MRDRRLIMGMPVTVEILDPQAPPADLDAAFDYFKYVDDNFSVFKEHSEISRLNRGEISLRQASRDLQEIFQKSANTKILTRGFFDIRTPQGSYNPSGLVKGWAIHRVAQLLARRGRKDYYVDAGGDIQACRDASLNPSPWTVGIRHPLETDKIVKVLNIFTEGVATSGTYRRGQHIYNPHQPEAALSETISLTVIGPNIYEADRMATAAFAMGAEGINFIEQYPGLEGYQIDSQGQALATSGFNKYVSQSNA